MGSTTMQEYINREWLSAMASRDQNDLNKSRDNNEKNTDTRQNRQDLIDRLQGTEASVEDRVLFIRQLSEQIHDNKKS